MQQLTKKLLICKVHKALKIIVKLQVEFCNHLYDTNWLNTHMICDSTPVCIIYTHLI